jgi:hypothetical protein
VTGYIAPATKILRYPGVLAAIQRGERVWDQVVGKWDK